MWEGSYWFTLGSFTLGLESDQVCCGLETVHGRQGKERRSETVLLAVSCQWELGEERRLISAVVGVWCRAQTQFKALLTLASGQAPPSVSHLRVGERGRGSARLKWLNTFNWEGGGKYLQSNRGPLSLALLLTHNTVIFQVSFSWWN